MSVRGTSSHRRVTRAHNEITLTTILMTGRLSLGSIGYSQYKIHITLEITEVTKIPMVPRFLLVPLQVVGADKPVPDMAVAIGVVRDSAKGQGQNRAVGKSGVPVEGTPRRGKEIRVTDIGTSMPQCCKG